MQCALFGKIDRLAQTSLERRLKGENGFRNRVYSFDVHLKRRYGLDQLRQVPCYHKLVGSTQQTQYEPIETHDQIQAEIDQFLDSLESLWEGEEKKKGAQ